MAGDRQEQQLSDFQTWKERKQEIMNSPEWAEQSKKLNDMMSKSHGVFERTESPADDENAVSQGTEETAEDEADGYGELPQEDAETSSGVSDEPDYGEPEYGEPQESGYEDNSPDGEEAMAQAAKDSIELEALGEESPVTTQTDVSSRLKPVSQDGAGTRGAVQPSAVEEPAVRTQNPAIPPEAYQEHEYPDDDEDDDIDDDLYDADGLILSPGQSSVSFDELNAASDEDNDEDGEDEIRKSQFSEKQDFSELSKSITGRKTPYKAGKLDKTRMLYIIGGVLISAIVVFGIANAVKTRKDATAKNASQRNMRVAGYDPDFGDYMSRRHQETPEDRNSADAAYIQTALGIGSDNGSRKTKEKTDPGKPKDTEPIKTRAEGQSSSAGTGAGTSGGSGTSGISREMKNAMDSPIGSSATGFGGNGASGSVPYMAGSGSGFSSQSSYPVDAAQEYLQGYTQTLGQLASAYGSQKTNADKANNGRYSTAGAYNPNASGGSYREIPDNSIYPGTVLQAEMVSGINTDYPGAITARIISPVYDSRTGKQLLIPQGSILRGSYSSSSIGVARVQIAWQELIINRNGRDYVVSLGSMIGVDRQGYSGIRGSLNDHWFQYCKAAGISVLFTYINANIYKVSNASASTTKQEMISSAQDVGNSLADKLLDRALDIQPTVTVKPGTRVNVDVDRILTLPPVENDRPTEKYVRK